MDTPEPNASARDNVIDFTGATKGPVDPLSILDGARHLKSVFVLGWDENNEFYLASSGGVSV